MFASAKADAGQATKLAPLSFPKADDHREQLGVVIDEGSPITDGSYIPPP
jgi:hypothetical protein